MKNTKRLYFPHIEGLRAVAALLVAVYHLYLGRVSGGVDVFFVVSGLLITLSLLHKIDDAGRLQWKNFLAGLGLRLLPAAGVVLLLVLALTFLYLPQVRHFETVREVLAAFLYFENWQLAFQATDYLDRENVPSPVQHYWAMSMQGQFYLIALSVFLFCVTIGRKLSLNATRLVGATYASVFAASLGYSIYQTHFGDQVWAYYDTFARVWEFCLGGLFGLLVVHRHDMRLPAFAGWLGLIAIVSCGVIFQVGRVFPGAAALFPTLAALMVIAGGRSSSVWSVGRLLGSKTLVSLGSVSYGIYLLHWPILIFYRELADVSTIDLVPGLAIIAASVAGAYVIHHFIEAPFLELRRKGTGARYRAIAVGATSLLVVFLGAYAFMVTVSKTGGHVEDLQFAGGRSLDGTVGWKFDDQPGKFIPEPKLVRRDLPRSYRDGCHAGLRKDELQWCVYGETEAYERTLAVVGGSHSAQWLPALEAIAERRRWRILYSTWSSCRLSTDQRDERCRSVMNSAMEKLAEVRPDLVFTTASVGGDHRPLRGYVGAWKKLEEKGIRVAALRDNPWMRSDVAECIGKHPDAPQMCGAPREDMLARNFDFSKTPGNVNLIDLSNFLCNADFCPVIIGNILVYRDRHHLTVPYVMSLTDVLEAHLGRIMDSAAPVAQAELSGTVEVIHGVLSCGAVGNNNSFERSIGVRLDGNVLEYRSGDWQKREGRFEFWNGRSEGSRMEVTGYYRDSRANPIREITLSGAHIDGHLILAGSRGPRKCTVSLNDG